MTTDLENKNGEMAGFDVESQIRQEVESEFPFLTPSQRSAIMQSRVKIICSEGFADIVRADLGEDASRKIKEDLFE